MPDEPLELVPHASQTPAIRQEQRPPSVAMMLQAVVEKGVTAENVGALEKLVDLYERMEIRDAEKQFAAAFVALQGDMPPIEAVKAVPNTNGSTRYKFAPYEEIMDKVRPVLQKHGFTLSFSSEFKDDRVIQACTLQHVGGHKRTNQSMARVGKGPPGSSEAQGDGAASTYAKRYALCDCLNIVVEHDSDGRNQDAKQLGAPISRDEVQYLREQVQETGSNEAIFLQMAGVKTYEEIGQAIYPMLVRQLNMKKGRK